MAYNYDDDDGYDDDDVYFNNKEQFSFVFFLGEQNAAPMGR